MVNVRTIALLATLGGIGAAIWYFKDQIGAAVAPSVTCPDPTWTLDPTSGQCCPSGFTYDATATNPTTGTKGACVRGTTTTDATGNIVKKVTGTDTTTSTTSGTGLIKTPTFTISPPTISERIIQQSKVIAADSTDVGVTTPISPYTPAVSYGSAAVPEDQLTDKTLYNFYLQVVGIFGQPLTRARIDIGGVDVQTVGILYTEDNGVANFMVQTAGEYRVKIFTSDGVYVGDQVINLTSDYNNKIFTVQTLYGGLW